MPFRLCLVCHRYQLTREYRSVHQALDRRFDITRVFVDDGWPSSVADVPDHESYDAFLWFVRFREFRTRPEFNWGGYHGARLMYDQDVCQDFTRILGTSMLGKWPDVFRRNEFHVLICTGKRTRDHLLERGVDAYWLPKAYDPHFFHDLGCERSGLSFFGEPYRARLAMLTHLDRNCIAYARFRSSYEELNHHLNRYLGCLICNMEGIPPAGWRRLVNLFVRGHGVTVQPGPETMLKNFEVAGAGCVPISDYMPEHDELGFQDAVSSVLYESFDELVEKLRHYETRPEELVAIGRQAAELVRSRHTWDHRAAAIEDLIVSRMPATALRPTIAK